jgi:hypothetical protein
MWPDWFALAGLRPKGTLRYRFDSFVAAFSPPKPEPAYSSARVLSLMTRSKEKLWSRLRISNCSPLPGIS